MTADVRQRVGLVVAMTFLVCCGRADTPHAGALAHQASGGATSVEQKVNSLKAEFPEARIQLDPDGSRIARIQSLKATAGSARAEDLARSVLQNNAVASALGLSADLRELCQPVSRKDPQLTDNAVVRMQQCVGGVKVLGAELVMNVRLKPSPAIDMLTSSLRPNLPPSTVAKITGAEASTAAVAAVKARAAQNAVSAHSPESGRTSPPPPELIVFVPAVFQLEGPARLCWLVRVDSMAVFVDAITGAVVHLYPEAQRGSIP
jgi:hypothetical protein